MGKKFYSYIECLLNGGSLTKDELLDIAQSSNTKELTGGANEVRKKIKGNQAHLCAALNVKSGCCSENCRYCSQSKYYNTLVKDYDILDGDVVKEFADYNLKNGVHNLGLSSSGGAYSYHTFCTSGGAERLLGRYHWFG